MLPEVTKYECWQRVGANITKSVEKNPTEIVSAITSHSMHQLFNKNASFKRYKLT
jgi:hypothetical protein